MSSITQYKLPTKIERDFLYNLSDKLFDINIKIPNINYGGCGIFAELLYNKLSLLGYNPEVVVLIKDWELEYYERSVKMLIDNGLHYYANNRTAGTPHIILKVDDFYVDSSGVRDYYTELPSYQYAWVEHIGLFTYEHLCICNRHVDLWSDYFNRRNIPKINTSLNKSIVRALNEVTGEKKLSQLFVESAKDIIFA